MRLKAGGKNKVERKSDIVKKRWKEKARDEQKVERKNREGQGIKAMKRLLPAKK